MITKKIINQVEKIKSLDAEIEDLSQLCDNLTNETCIELDNTFTCYKSMSFKNKRINRLLRYIIYREINKLEKERRKLCKEEL